MPIASPQHRQSAVRRDCDCGERRDRQRSQTGTVSGEESARNKEPPHARQSAGKTVATRSSTTETKDCPGLRRTRTTARHSIIPPGSLPGGPPGGAPVETSSALSFMLSLKTHLTRWRSRSVRPRHGRSIAQAGSLANQYQVNSRTTESYRTREVADRVECNYIRCEMWSPR
jgi:hypothetical protein